ncbi:MAG: helix-turn-helix transcriptional regulator [Methylocella sp.]
MAEHQCLYERAAAAPFAPLLHVGPGHMIASGQAVHLSSHQGGVPVYLVGLYGKFLLRMAAGRWQSCRTAIVPPGMLHELKFHDEPFVAFYIEPCTGGLETLKPLMRGARDSDGAWIGSGGEISLMRALYEDRSNRQDAGAILDDLLGFAQKQVVRTLDPRVARVAESLREGSDDDLTPVACKAAAGLSSSRLQHLFSEQVGVPYRRYRAWSRMRAAMWEIQNHSNFTVAAHASGYSDSAHFSHDFRRTFGTTGSALRVLARK